MKTCSAYTSATDLVQAPYSQFGIQHRVPILLAEPLLDDSISGHELARPNPLQDSRHLSLAMPVAQSYAVGKNRSHVRLLLPDLTTRSLQCHPAAP